MMATLVALAVGGLVSTSCGVALADDPGASATGGSGAASTVFQQNTAQENKQNDNCSNMIPGFADLGELTAGRAKARCVTDDASWNEHAITKGGGARAEGGNSAAGAFEQNTAQSGRQNNNCANTNLSDVVADLGGRQRSACANKDASRTKRSVVKGGDARTDGGNSTGVTAYEQNTAQSGRQNNNCANPTNTVVTAIDGGRQGSVCGNKDASRTKRSVVKGGDARAEGGTDIAFEMRQQNTAQSGRQNNNCANPNTSDFTAIRSGRQDSVCGNKDASRTKRSVVKGGGARAEGGTSAVGAFKQNTAQSGRQNNNCVNAVNSGVTTIGSGRQGSVCGNKDASRTKRSVVKGGGARAEGGTSIAGGAFQQNTAQSGRQNNNCANPNGSQIRLTDSRAESRCQTFDGSKNVGTVEISDGAEAEGGSGALDLFQQNTAQSGRQNNNCANPNRLTLTATGNRTQTQCVAVDRSKNIGSVSR
jgi:hypothetical protein